VKRSQLSLAVLGEGRDLQPAKQPAVDADIAYVAPEHTTLLV